MSPAFTICIQSIYSPEWGGQGAGGLHLSALLPPARLRLGQQKKAALESQRAAAPSHREEGPGPAQSRRCCPERKAWRETAADLRGLQGADLGPRAWLSMDTLGTLVTLPVNSPFVCHLTVSCHVTPEGS